VRVRDAVDQGDQEVEARSQDLVVLAEALDDEGGLLGDDSVSFFAGFRWRRKRVEGG
jgi:hypothetical protein